MLEQKVEAFLTRKKINLMGASILVGVSGGPDSLALLHFLWKRQERYQLKLIVSHVDHMFRGDESEREARFVQSFCEERNIPITVHSINVPLYMEETGLSSQVAARECRYSFFQETMRRENLHYLMLGHHGDDQIETVIMRLTRGSSGKARVGIPFSRPFDTGTLLRPFLCVSKQEVEEYCQINRLEPRRDPSNDSNKYSRNRFRHTILPFLKGENPRVHEHFQRFSEEMEETERYMEELANQQLPKVMKLQSEKKIIVDIQILCSMPMPLQRRVIKLILNYLYKHQPASLAAVHIEQIFSLINNPHPSGMIDLPDKLKVARSYGELEFQFQHSIPKDVSYEIELTVGKTLLPTGDFITWEYVDKEIEYTNINQLLLPFPCSGLPLKVRTRREGDKMRVKGMKGTKKIKDIFIDKKLPILERNRWPLVTDSNDHIIWIPGIKKSDTSSWIQADQKKYILLKYNKQ
jgi:tRNA(Ile)-lysidine synthase